MAAGRAAAPLRPPARPSAARWGWGQRRPGRGPPGCGAGTERGGARLVAPPPPPARPPGAAQGLTLRSARAAVAAAAPGRRLLGPAAPPDCCCIPPGRAAAAAPPPMGAGPARPARLRLGSRNFALVRRSGRACEAASGASETCDLSSAFLAPYRAQPLCASSVAVTLLRASAASSCTAALQRPKRKPIQSLCT
ncbi:atherin-like isoform X2 [Cavia porcellus]|uniref:atherin-like isoform X2 n=1 Tax=Cavia porcellus TaxID=10141 RepID=UPI002FDFCEEA